MNCKCSLAISLCGDGCRYCQPQSYIDRLVDQYEENETEYKAALIKARGALEFMKKRIPEPTPVGLDETGHPEYANDTDHSNAWELFEIVKALTAINEVLS